MTRFTWTLALCASVVASTALLADVSGPLNPQAVVNIPIAATENWGAPGGAAATGGGAAFVDLGTLVTETESARLEATDFGFAIPAGATIDGIEVVVNRDGQTRAGAGSGEPLDFGILIMKGGVPTGSDHSNAIPWSDDGGDFPPITYGSSSDTWGETWTAADINSAGFGISIRAHNPLLRAQGRIDAIRITVHYTPAASVPAATAPVAAGLALLMLGLVTWWIRRAA